MKIYIKYFIAILFFAFTGIYFVNKLANPYMPKFLYFTPRGYKRSRYSSQRVYLSDGNYVYNYSFIDHRRNRQTFIWQLNKQLVDSMVRKFGIDWSLFTSRRFRARNRYELRRKMQAFKNLQNRALRAGMFTRIGSNTIIPDHNAMVRNYMGLMRPVYNVFNNLANRYRLTLRERVELLLRFCQVIPYGIPPRKNSYGKHIGGILTPPQIFNYKWGDCDSKCVLFASIMAHDPRFRNRVINMISVSGHMFLGLYIRRNAYDYVVNYRGRPLVVCEPVGIGRLPVGRRGSNRSMIKYIIPIVVSGGVNYTPPRNENRPTTRIRRRPETRRTPTRYPRPKPRTGKRGGLNSFF